jgi:hypothetical protein
MATDDSDPPGAPEPARPSWLPGPCPTWCTRRHREQDRPEDRLHQDDGVVLAAVVGRLDETTLRPVPHPAELVVRLVREAAEQAPTWVVVAETEEAGLTLLLTRDSAVALRAALPAAAE